MSGPIASVVIPAHDEEAVLARSLRSLLAEATPGELDVVVVANACSDRTVEVARQAGVRVVETSVPGKAHALRLGDDACRVFPRVYLDADVELTAGCVRALVVALRQPGMLAGAPVPHWDLTGASPLTRRVHRVHDRLHAPHRALAGVGVYALTEQGHDRVFPLPEVVSDDGWVQSSFAPSERIVVTDGYSVIRPTRTLKAHLRRRLRIRYGNRQLAEMGRPPTEGRRTLRDLVALVARGDVSFLDAICYLEVLAVDRTLARLQALRRIEASWSTDHGSRAGAGAEGVRRSMMLRGRRSTARRPRVVVAALVMAAVAAAVAIVLVATATSAPRGLAPVPWEGGPSYYEQFPSAQVAGWTDPAFFPIGVWYQHVGDQQDVDSDKAAGINTYVELTSDSDMGLVRRNGMTAITSQPLPEHGSETIGWLLDDEVDMRAGPGNAAWTNIPGRDPLCAVTDTQCGYTVLRDLTKRLPADNGRLRYANYGKGVLMWETDDEASVFVNDYTQIVSADAYWYTDPSLCGDAQNFLAMPADQCQRSANYGMTVDRERALDGRDERRQPIFAFVEDGWPSADTGRAIRPQELAGAVMNSLIHGARGIIYFNHSFGGDCQSDQVMRDPCGATIRGAVTEMDSRIRQLAPVLNTPSYAYPFNTGLDTMLKEYAGSFYAFVMLKRDSAPGSYQLTLPPGPAGSRVEALFENRSVPLTGARQLIDSFPAEYSYHVYKITPP